MATYRKRGRVWRAEICVSGIRDSATFDTKAEAQLWAEEKATELRKKQAASTSALKELAKGTLGDLLGYVLTHKTVLARTRRTREAETSRIEKMRRHPICAKPIRQLLTTDFLDYKKSRELEGIVHSTIRRELNIVRAAINQLIATGELSSNAAAGVISTLPEDPEQSRLLSDQEILQFQRAHEDLNRSRRKNPWLFFAFSFAGETGLRKAELVALEWTNVDINKRTALIREVDDIPDESGKRTTAGTKNGSTRKIPLSASAIEILLCVPRATDPQGNRMKVMPGRATVRDIDRRLRR